jgi:hypothetical protein
MEERDKTDPTEIRPEDATPSDDEEAPQPPPPDPEHVVEKKGEES